MDASKKMWLSLTAVLLVFVIVTGCGGSQGEAESTPLPESVKDWSLIPINLTESPADGGGTVLHVDFAARNDSGDWSSMAAADPEDRSAKLTTKDGKEYSCDTIQVSSGGHYLPPGFQMQGYMSKRDGIKTLFVECNVAESSPGGSLTIPYTIVTGEYDYYEKGENVFESQLTVDLEQSPPTLAYPVDSSKVESQAITEEIVALNKTTLSNTGVNRAGDEISFQWKVTNPGEYGTKVHIGRPPVLGSDGIVYGARVSPDIVDVPTAGPDGGTSEFETQVEVPSDVENLYLLLSVEQKRERLFSNYLIDLTELQ
jgi:hypothetical protein